MISMALIMTVCITGTTQCERPEHLATTYSDSYITARNMCDAFKRVTEQKLTIVPTNSRGQVMRVTFSCVDEASIP